MHHTHRSSRLRINANLCTGLLLASLFTFTSSAGAQTSPVFPVVRDLATVLRDPVDERLVVLKGQILKHLSGDKYLFSSGKQQIQLEIDTEVVPTVQNITAQTWVEIEGEIEKNPLQTPEIEVHRIRVLPQ